MSRAAATALVLSLAATLLAGEPIDRRIHKALRGVRVVERAELVTGKAVVLGEVVYGSRLFLTVNRLHVAADLRRDAAARLAGLPGMPRGVVVVVLDEEGVVVDRFALGEPSFSLPAEDRVTAAAASADGRTVAMATLGAEAAIHIVDPSTGASGARLPTGKAIPIVAMAMGDNGAILVIQGDELFGTTPAGFSRRLRLDRAPRLAAIAAEGNVIVVVGDDGLVRLLDGRDGHTIDSLQLVEPVTSIAISPRGDRVAFSAEGSIVLWEPGSPDVRWRRAAPAGTIAFLEDAVVLRAGGELRTYDLMTGEAF